MQIIFFTLTMQIKINIKLFTFETTVAVIKNSHVMN